MSDLVEMEEAMELLGVSKSTFRRLYQEGKLTIVATSTLKFIFLREEVEKLKENIRPSGQSITQIATRFGITRQAVHKRFVKYRVKPSARDRYGGALYSDWTVNYFAALFHWQESPPESRKDEPQSPQSA